VEQQGSEQIVSFESFVVVQASHAWHRSLYAHKWCLHSFLMVVHNGPIVSLHSRQGL